MVERQVRNLKVVSSSLIFSTTMKRTIVSLIAAAAFCFAAVPSQGKIITDSLYSTILHTTVKYNVYLPEGYKDKGEKYPSIYLLHGLSGDHINWEKNSRMHEVADELMASGECRKSVIFMPNAGGKDTHNIQNGYFNVQDWAYEDFFFKEFVPQVEKKYHCIADKEHRAVMGLSMGGGGSTVYCIRHSDMFSSCYAMSAWLDTEVDENQPKDKLYITRESVHANSPFKLLENVDKKTVQQLNTVHWFFDCGDDDGLLYYSVDLHRKYKELGINTELRVMNGIHNWEYWHRALRDALAFASRNFGK